jgi:hypothetical protein
MPRERADSRDYITVAGSKELLDHLDYNPDPSTPWTPDQFNQYKPIIREYLDHVYVTTNKKISNSS